MGTGIPLGRKSSLQANVIQMQRDRDRETEIESERVKNHYMVSLDVLSFFNSHIMYKK
jgi:hypothetical protein